MLSARSTTLKQPYLSFFLGADVCSWQGKLRRKLKELLDALGAQDHLHLVVGPGGHRFYADAAWPVALREIARLKRPR